ncbi:hypothetical protein C0J52_27750, partial [Blattella germanica]
LNIIWNIICQTINAKIVSERLYYTYSGWIFRWRMTITNNDWKRCCNLSLADICISFFLSRSLSSTRMRTHILLSVEIRQQAVRAAPEMRRAVMPEEF